MLALVLIAMPLAACDQSVNALPPSTQLPPMPADLRACLERSGVDIPDRALTVAEVERLWKQDRLRIVVMRNCGRRVIAWYDDLRKGWR